MSQPQAQPNEADWITRIRAGDADAFEALFRTYYAPLCDFVEGYLGSDDATRELVQDLFARIWENRRDWFVRGSLKPYLFTAARNSALNELRHEKTRRRLAEAMHWVAAPPGMGEAPVNADQQVENQEFEAGVRDAVARLPERYRRVFELRSHHGLTHAEVARILDLPVKTVETQSRRALQSLRTLLARFRET